MWLSLLLLLFLIAATYFQAIQGATSAVIMAVLTVLCVALSFGTYEAVANAALMGLAPDYAHGIAFLGMFLIPLFVLRILMDMLVSRANQLPHLLDRAAAGVVGFFAAILMTGMLAIGIQMIPWPSTIGYSRFNAEDPNEQNELWLRPDRAAASFGVALTQGVFSGPEQFDRAHPDLVSELGWVQTAKVGVRRTAPADAVSFESGGPLEYIYDATAGRGGDPNRYDQVDPRGGYRFLRVLLEITGSADEMGDSDERMRYVPASVLLVGERGGTPEVYSAIAVPSEDDANYFIRSLKSTEKIFVAGQTLNVPESNLIEVAFEIPETFIPREVRYKFGAAATYRARRPAEAPIAAQPTVATASPTPTPYRGGGRTSGVRFRSSHFGNAFPLKMTAYQSHDAETSGDVFEQGHLVGLLADQGSTNRDQPLAKFKVPAGKALLQLNVESLHAGSLLGKALNQAATTLEDYNIVTDRGNRIGPVGKYAVAKVGNDRYVELMYFPGYAAGGARAIRPFSKIKHTHLKGDYQLVYLYLVDSGTRVTRFDPGGNKRKTDLAGENLVAP